MKRVKILLCTMFSFALVLILSVFAENKVCAATKDTYYGYDSYVDLVEGRGLEAGAVKVDVNGNSGAVAYGDGSGNYTYYTYKELAETHGYVIPSSCVQILIDEVGMAYVGYHADGSKEVIYKNDGYDILGYDKNGKNRGGDSYETKIACIVFANDIGYDPWEGFKFENRKTLTYKLVRTDKAKDQFRQWGVYDTAGNFLDDNHYTITVKKKSVDKYGHGWYTISVQTDETYHFADFTNTITVIPQKVKMESIADRASARYVYNVRYFLPKSEYKKKGMVGIEYKIGALKGRKVTKNKKTYTIFEEGKFAKNCKSGSLKWGKQKAKRIANSYWGKDGFLLASFRKEDRKILYEYKVRGYVVVDGKKIYSQWADGVTLPTGIKYELRGFSWLKNK